MREARGKLALVCPTGGDAHGKLITTERGFYCPHQSHDGKPSEPPTKRFFTYEEVTNG